MRNGQASLSQRAGRWMTAAVFALSLSACAATFNNHGYVPPETDLAQISIGASRDAVIEAIGTPGAAGVMRDEAWFYTAYRVRNYAYRAPEITEREVVAVSFSDAGRVTNIERFGLEDGQFVELSRRVTTSSIREVTFLRQVLQNFGQINIGEALSSE